MRRHSWILIVLVALGLWVWAQPRLPAGSGRVSGPAAMFGTGASAPAGRPSESSQPARDAARYPAFLPVEARTVLERIERGGPFAYRQDGGVFQNREHQLPPRARGYYREYTVDTPGSPDRGARRIITGGQPPHEYWYTDDHYRSFRRFEVLR